MIRTNNIRMNLRLFRQQQLLTMEEMAQRIGVIRSTYSAIETGKREGRKTLWDDLQLAFGLTDDEIQELKKIG